MSPKDSRTYNGKNLVLSYIYGSLGRDLFFLVSRYEQREDVL